MTFLLDTHTFLWACDASAQLSAPAREAILDPSQSKYLSVASAWELAIKHSHGRLLLQLPFEQFIKTGLAKTNCALYPAQIPHLSRVASLPFHHKDPFDRLIVAQALVDGLRLLSNDAKLDAYGVTRQW